MFSFSFLLLITFPFHSFLRSSVLRKQIEALERILNRTPQQKQDLKDKRQKLAELERQQQEGGFKKYLPWIIGGEIILVLVIGVIAYFL
jgi:hypothetical protein